MEQVPLYVLTAAGLFAIGVYGLLVQTHLLRRILAVNVIGNAVFLLLVAWAVRDGRPPDPVPHAMVLTGIVIAVSATAFALALLRRYYRDTGRVSLEDREDGPG
ncbi:sodium:proton antiporter [Alkalilimnicola ehrlichii MLHE-1]|uniref:Multisubunit sodium/proton antiporter, MrpC subunit n=1 Tax=Alkalilimnicola ehrlichii (strain ATCC BAA-1101 / DSM 17681 / MLHE-1) TaxID=187272 RepID=Q0AAP1_ALKEH|nr:NADH-quinone oxidoreductase subunit K [Alkalilimnicola ehrlichii]ABI56096.1 multisubunit sodium/proton antiporter, MrpC subunit [Alkalilimnicola ehrlichii MLHE-1]